MNSTFPPASIKAMSDLWFRMGDVQQDEPIPHADRDKFSAHDLVFTFEGAGGAPVEFRCDAAFFLGRLWEDRLVPELFRWSHVRSSNDDESDIAVIGMVSNKAFFAVFLAQADIGVDAELLLGCICEVQCAVSWFRSCTFDPVCGA